MNLYESLHELERRGGTAALCTIIRTRGSVPRHVGTKMLVYPDRRIEGTIGGGEMESRIIQEAVAALAQGEARVVSYSLVAPEAGDPGVCGGAVEVFVEPLRPLPTVLVIGGGHLGRAVVHLAKWLGFRVAVSDDRPEFCTSEAVPEADEYLPVPLADLPRKFRFTADTYIVLVTRRFPIDVEALPHLLDVPHAYLGVLGSRRRWAVAAKQLRDKGIPQEKLARVHAPMGLELNAETPEEIALSIMAEVVARRRGGTGAAMKWTGEPQATDAATPKPS